MRKLIPTLLAVPLLLPSVAYPLGLGDIRLQSGLNQPFSGEIDLLSVRADEAPSIQVALGSYETFNRLGIDRASVLSKLQFKIKKRPSGSYYVEVTSKQPIRDPFLDFLIEVNWSSGRLLREYTVLLDPPDLMKQPPAPVHAPSVAAARSTASSGTIKNSAPVSSPAASSSTARSSGTQSTAAEAKSQPKAASKSAPRASHSAGKARASAQKARPSSSAARRGSYGPVRKNETLWSIAKRMRPDHSVTMAQMMLALLKANPDAFYENNINMLKQGAVLRMNPSLARQMSRAEATREVRRQNRAWQDYKLRAARRAKGRPATEPSKQPGKSIASAPKSRLKLVSPEDGQSVQKDRAASSAPGTGKNPADSRKQLMLAMERAEAKEQENAELRKRLKEMKDQMSSMQRLLKLKDDDLATLQQQLGKEPKTSPAGQSGEAAAAQTPAGQTPGEDTTKATGTGEVSASTSLTEEGQTAPSDSAKLPTENGAAQPAASVQKPKEDGVGKAPAPAQRPKKPIKVKNEPKPEPPLLDQVLGTAQKIFEDVKSRAMANPLVAGGVAAGVAFLLLIMMMIRRRRGGGFQESILTAGDTSSMLRAKEAEGQSEDTSFFSDFAVSGMGDIQTEDSEVDPLTEADVYMAYGRYQQAEELLTEALKHNRNSPEAQAKLLEVYHATKNREAFEQMALDAQTNLTNAGLWGKIVVMGHDLAPDNPIFEQAPNEPVLGNTAEAETKADVLEDDVLDIGLDLDAFAEEAPSETSEPEQQEDDFSLDLGVDFSDLDESSPAADGENGVGEDEGSDSSIDLDFGDLNLGEESSDSAGDAAGESQDLDFDLSSLGQTEEPDESEEPEPGDEFIGGVGFGLGGLDVTEDDSEDSSDLSGAGGADFGGLDLATEPEDGASPESSEGMDFGGLDLDGDSGQAEDTEFGDLNLGDDSEQSENMDFGDLDLGDDSEQSEDTDFGGLDLGDDSGESEGADFGGLDLGDDSGESEGTDFGGLDLGDDSGESEDMDFGGLDLGDDSGESEDMDFGGLDLGSDSGQSEDTDFGGLDLGEDTEEPQDIGFGGLDLQEEGDSFGESEFGDLGLGDGDTDTGSLTTEEDDSVDFGGLDLDGSGTAETSDDSESDVEGLDDMDFGDLGLDDGAAVHGSASGQSADGLDLDSFADDLEDDEAFGDLDEVGTKLDLAKAYVDMGDAEGAQSILEEVLQEGNDQQKAQAQSLMQQIA